MCSLKKVILLSFLLSASYFIRGQEYVGKVEHFSIEEGLSSRFVNDLLQDSDGFLWIATNYGLNRFDGYDFKVFTGEETGWSSDIIWQLMEDQEQYLWVSTKKGAGISTREIQDVYFIHLPTMEILSWAERFPDAPIKAKDIEGFYQHTGTVYLTTNRGEIYKIDLAGRQFGLIYKNPNILYKELWVLSGDTLVFTAHSAVNNLRSHYYELDSAGNVLCKKPVGFWGRYIEASAPGERLVTFLSKNPQDHYETVFDLNECGETVYPIKDLGPLSTTNNLYTPFSYIQNKSQDLWLISKDQVELINPQKGRIFNFTPLFDPPPSFLGIARITAGTDYSGWICFPGTESGFYRYSLKENHFRTIIPWASRNIIDDGQSSVYIQTQNGFVRYHESSGSIEQDFPFSSLAVPLLKDHQGAIWSAEPHLGMFFRFKPVGGQLDTLYANADAYRGENWWSFFESPELPGTIWIGGNSGLYRVNFKEAEPSILPFGNPSDPGDLENSRILSFLETAPDSIWLSTSNGFYLIDPRRGVREVYNKDQNGKFYLPVRYINHAYRDPEGIFWLATRGDGLVRWDRSSHTFQTFKEEQGLSHNVIYAVYEDKEQGLWLSSDRGIMCFDKDSHRVRTFLARDGLPHEEFNTASHYQSEDGRIWFGGLGGVTVFDPKAIREGALQNRIPIVSEFQMYDASAGSIVDRTMEVRNSRRIVLNPGDKDFLIKFSLLQFDNPTSNSFGWKIEGWDQDWKYQQDNAIRVTGLPPGPYQMLVQAQGANGNWSETPLNLEIVVKKHFYQQTWFFLLLAMLAVGLLYWRFLSIKRAKKELELLVAQRTDQIRKDKSIIESQAAELKKLDELKSRFFANVSHELRTPLTLILAPMNKMLRDDPPSGKRKEHLEIMQRNGQRLLKLVEELLDLSRLDARKIQLKEEKVNLRIFLSRVISAFQSQAEIQEIDYALDYQADRDLLVMVDQVKVERIVINLLSNAFKHTLPGGTIRLKVTATGDQILIEVSDTGKGISPEDLPHIFNRFYQTRQAGVPLEGGTGIGLALSKEYVDLLGGDLSVESSPGKGSVFKLILPKKEVVPEAGKPEFQPEKDPDPNISPLPAGNGKVYPKTSLLLVEDNPDMQVFLREVLDEFGQLNVASNGRVALDWLKKQDSVPDLVISDVMMPEMDGFTLLETLRANESWRQIPVVMLTARADRTDRMQGLLLGVDDYLIKPFDVEELQARIHNILRRIQRQKDATRPGFSSEPLPSAGTQWLQELEKVSLRALKKSQLSVSLLAHEMALSERQFRRKLREYTGFSPKDFLREVRLQKARQLLENKAFTTVAEVAYQVGFSKVEYFSQLYFDRFGKMPSTYL